MPELPEVETIKNDLKRKILNREIVKFKAIKPGRIIRGGLRSFQKQIQGQKFKAINRRGKLLIFTLSKNNFLLIHLKMTGQLIYQKGRTLVPGGHDVARGSLDKELGGADLPNRYTHAIFTFKDGSQLFFNDLRKFGYLEIVSPEKLEKIQKTFGIEPGLKNFTLASLEKILAGKNRAIKSLLMEQKQIAGIGNIYADEILFESRIKPTRLGKDLNKKEVESLFKAVNKIIKKAIKWGGTTFNSYRDASGRQGNFYKFLKVYHREKKDCLVCQSKINRIKVGGRSSYFCPHCQK